MDEFPPPFGPQEWNRLRALDRRCDLNLHRYVRDRLQSQAVPSMDRIWLVSIQLRDGMHSDNVRAIQPALKDAMLQALAQAEQRGWHQPRASEPSRA